MTDHKDQIFSHPPEIPDEQTQARIVPGELPTDPFKVPSLDAQILAMVKSRAKGLSLPDVKVIAAANDDFLKRVNDNLPPRKR